jgi:hypothetical protein
MVTKNKNSRIVQNQDSGFLSTETARRDLGETNFVISTDVRNNSSLLTIVGQGGQTATTLTGRQARTLLMVLQRHMSELDAQLNPNDVWF